MKRMSETGLLAVLFLAGCHRSDQDSAACKNSSPDASIVACTALLQSSGLTDSARASALQNRGIAYRAKGDYDRAIADHGQAITLRPGFAAAFNSRGLVYQIKGEYERAIADYNAAIKLKPDLAAALKNRGRSEFYLGRFADAATDLRAGLQFDSSNAYNVIWLYLATMRLGSADARDFAAQLRRTDSVRWPAPVAQYYLGRLTAEQLMAAAARPDPATRIDQRCAGAFYIGESDLWARRFAEADQRFREAVATCSKDFSEYQGAAAELGRSAATAH